ncbi:hypothetical protein Poly41_21920 [Novipirellula artificiosorum]|uniref:Uncharacterized protein n=1 Tax=Novipirellula artificiosorum TaxID=2528016 RepID=A0A5C6DRH9_9BACT|nr:hypothetical protein Poly41_21920 [Novipirellula artificiosorum]
MTGRGWFSKTFGVMAWSTAKSSSLAANHGRDGSFCSGRDLARACQVSHYRLTQILNLSCLAPDIQEQLLHLARYSKGRAPFTEREVRPIAGEPDWDKQRTLFAKLIDQNDRTH